MQTTITSSDHSQVAFTRVDVREAVFRDSEGDFAPDWEARLRDFTIRIGVKLLFPEDRPEVTVFLTATVEPPDGLTLFKELSVTLSGGFSTGSNDRREWLSEFAMTQAPLLLWPYLRQAISTLTSQSRFGSLVLPPVNMQPVVAAMRDKAKAPTAGGD